MSEEEIIDEITYNILNDPFIVFSQDSSFEDVQIKANAIQGLLDLYNKEKEKNKTVRDRIEYYLLDNMSLENNPEKLKKELIKLKELLGE